MHCRERRDVPEPELPTEDRPRPSKGISASLYDRILVATIGDLPIPDEHDHGVWSVMAFSPSLR
jgi:hypothetical protein